MGVDVAINEIKKKTPTYRVSRPRRPRRPRRPLIVGERRIDICSHFSRTARGQRLHLRHRPERLRAAASQPAAQSEFRRGGVPELARLPLTCLTSFLSSAQIINFREPVTLDFLDAELEDNNKEEVTHVQTSANGLNTRDGGRASNPPPTCLTALVHRHAASVVTASFWRSPF